VGFITANRKQQVFFGYSLDEFVPADAKCRFVAELVEGLDLRSLYADYSDQGGDAYDPSVMLATWFFAYSEGVTSTRDLEQRCLRDTHFIYVSADLHPDHTSLSRFRKRHLALLPDFFVQLVRLAQQKGLSGFRRICVDGTRIKANASPEKSLNADELDRALAKVRTDTEEYLRECELEDGGNGELGETESRLAELQRIESKYAERRRQLEERRATLLRKNRANHRINMTDPDALSMKKVNGRNGTAAYNGQASVDADSGLIVAAEAVAEGNDARQFPRQHAQVEANLGIDREREYTADKGYHTIEALEYIKQNGVDGVIADPRPDRRSRESAEPPPAPPAGRRLRRGDFAYDRANDTYVCPSGHCLTYRFDWTDSAGCTFRIYANYECAGCPLSTRCVGKGDRGKRLFRNPREDLAEAMAAKAASEEGTARMNERFGCSEPVFGNLKENLGFRNFRLRGLAAVKGEFLLMCLGHNLNVLFRRLAGIPEKDRTGTNPDGNAPADPFAGPVTAIWRLITRRYGRRAHSGVPYGMQAVA
jgi:transposase